MPNVKPFSDTTLLELRELLDEEMSGLPDEYRAPLVLCYLQGLTNEEAARRLGQPSSSVLVALARARKLLSERLGRRGVALPVGLFGALLLRCAAAPELSARLVDTTVKTALQAVTRKSVAASVSARSTTSGSGPD
jgi:RNA polymerase sigma-70 factor (ECF subfamily)